AERDRHSALHVAGPEAVQVGLVAPGGQVVVERHGVEVAGDHDPLGATEVGAGHHVVAVADHLEVVVPAQRTLDGVGDLLLLPAHRGDVDQLLGEGDDVHGQVEVRCRCQDRKSTRLNSSHVKISYAGSCLKTKTS